MRLVGESACECNVRQSLPRGYHHELGALDSSSHDVCKGGGTDALIECPREMTLAQGRAIGELTKREFRSEIFLYVLQSQGGLPNRETPAPRNTSKPWHPSADLLEFSAEECRCIPQAAPRHLATRIKQCHNSPHRRPDPRQGGCTRTQPLPLLGTSLTRPPRADRMASSASCF